MKISSWYRVALVLLPTIGVLVGCNSLSPPVITTVVLVRHAERPPGENPSLTQAGLERADLLEQIMRSSDLAAIFATQYCRTVQTVQPLAQALDLTPQIYLTSGTVADFSDCDPAIQVQTEVYPTQSDHARELAERILSDYQGRTVLISGHSDTVPAIIAELGADPVCPRLFPFSPGSSMAGNTSEEECHIQAAQHDNLFVVTVYDRGKADLLRLRYGAVTE